MEVAANQAANQRFTVIPLFIGSPSVKPPEILFVLCSSALRRHHDVLREVRYLSLRVPDRLLCPRVFPAAEEAMKRHPRGTNETRQADVGSYHHA